MTRRVRRAAAVTAHLAGWLLAVVTAVTMLAQVSHLDRWWQVVALIALSPWLVALVVIDLIAALTARRWALSAVAGFLALAGLVWVVPSLSPLDKAAQAPAGATEIRVFDANVRFDNPSLAGIADEIIADHPDVVTLEEITAPQVAELNAAGALRRFHWRFVRPGTSNATGIGIWSDHPLRHATEWQAGYHPEVSGQLVLPDRRVITIDAIHTTAPRPGAVGEWRRELAAIAAKTRAQQRPLLVVGDFNATTQMWEFDQILHVGLYDAAIETGNGWRMTWSRLVPVIPPLVRLDHVLYSPELTVTSYRLGTGQGSDHRPVLATIASS